MLSSFLKAKISFAWYKSAESIAWSQFGQPLTKLFVMPDTFTLTGIYITGPPNLQSDTFPWPWVPQASLKKHKVMYGLYQYDLDAISPVWNDKLGFNCI